MTALDALRPIEMQRPMAQRLEVSSIAGGLFVRSNQAKGGGPIDEGPIKWPAFTRTEPNTGMATAQASLMQNPSCTCAYGMGMLSADWHRAQECSNAGIRVDRPNCLLHSALGTPPEMHWVNLGPRRPLFFTGFAESCAFILPG